MRPVSGTVDKARVAAEFNRHAGGYDRHCEVQTEMAAALMQQISTIGPVRTILELGCGTGALTEMLVRRFPEADLVAVDLAENMVRTAEVRLKGSRVRFAVADAEHLDWEAGGFDLIVSNATLQWFEAPGKALAQMAAGLRPGGTMAHAAFGPATLRELFEVYEEMAPKAIRGLPMPHVRDCMVCLLKAGLADVRGESRLQTVVYPDAAAFLTALKTTGTAPGRIPGRQQWSGYRLAREAVRRYDRRFSGKGGVHATYETIMLSGVAARRLTAAV